MRARYGVFICALRVFRQISVNEFLAFELHVGHRSVVFICHQWLSTSTACDFCTLLLPTVWVRTVCVDTEQKNTKLNNCTWLNELLTIGEYQSFLEGWFMVVLL